MIINESSLITAIENERINWEKQNAIATNEENGWYDSVHKDTNKMKAHAMREGKARKAMDKHESNYKKLAR